MEKLDNIVKMLREQYFFKEILRIAIGIVFIFIIDLIFSPDLNLIPNYNFISPGLIILVIIILSYFISRISCDLGSLMTKTAYFAFKKDKRGSISRYLGKLKDYINNDTYRLSPEELSGRSQEEIIEQFKESTYLRNIFDEADIRLMISNSFLGFCFIAAIVSIFVPHLLSIKYFLATCAVFLTYSFVGRYNLSKSARKLVTIHVRNEKKVPKN